MPAKVHMNTIAFRGLPWPFKIAAETMMQPMIASAA